MVSFSFMILPRAYTEHNNSLMYTTLVAIVFTIIGIILMAVYIVWLNFIIVREKFSKSQRNLKPEKPMANVENLEDSVILVGEALTCGPLHDYDNNDKKSEMTLC